MPWFEIETAETGLVWVAETSVEAALAETGTWATGYAATGRLSDTRPSCDHASNTCMATRENFEGELSEDACVALPACCRFPEGAEFAHRLYAAYNMEGPRKTQGLNYQGLPCPPWDRLPETVKTKWRGVAAVMLAAMEESGGGFPNVRKPVDGEEVGSWYFGIETGGVQLRVVGAHEDQAGWAHSFQQLMTTAMVAVKALELSSGAETQEEAEVLYAPVEEHGEAYRKRLMATWDDLTHKEAS